MINSDYLLQVEGGQNVICSVVHAALSFEDNCSTHMHKNRSMSYLNLLVFV